MTANEANKIYLPWERQPCVLGRVWLLAAFEGDVRDVDGEKQPRVKDLLIHVKPGADDEASLCAALVET